MIRNVEGHCAAAARSRQGWEARYRCPFVKTLLTRPPRAGNDNRLRWVFGEPLAAEFGLDKGYRARWCFPASISRRLGRFDHTLFASYPLTEKGFPFPAQGFTGRCSSMLTRRLGYQRSSFAD